MKESQKVLSEPTQVTYLEMCQTNQEIDQEKHGEKLEKWGIYGGLKLSI